ncbi:MAG: GNAT family N-acetyltransferase [Acidimicrobiales bacterium]|jgi:ribosomal protein S18 acetylase RimI-like enzyme
MEIRPIRPDEYDTLGQITVEAYRNLQRDTRYGDYEKELMAVAARAVDSVVLVAVDGDEVVGGVTYVPDAERSMSEFSDPDAAGIRMLAVRPDCQGAGVGKALTAACIEQARADGRSRILLHSTEVMQVAREMYRRMGFVEVPELDRWVLRSPGPDLRLIAFALALNDLGSPATAP